MRIENDNFVIITAYYVQCLALNTSDSAYPSLMFHKSEVMRSIVFGYLIEADSTGEADECGILFKFYVIYATVDDSGV
jgi:hypothetical protein